MNHMGDALKVELAAARNEVDQLRAALLDIARLDHSNSCWGPGLARQALIKRFEKARG